MSSLNHIHHLAFEVYIPHMPKKPPLEVQGGFCERLIGQSKAFFCFSLPASLPESYINS